MSLRRYKYQPLIMSVCKTTINRKQYPYVDPTANHWRCLYSAPTIIHLLCTYSSLQQTDESAIHPVVTAVLINTAASCYMTMWQLAYKHQCFQKLVTSIFRVLKEEPIILKTEAVEPSETAVRTFPSTRRKVWFCLEFTYATTHSVYQLTLSWASSINLTARIMFLQHFLIYSPTSHE
jgi:hypothetical protein